MTGSTELSRLDNHRASAFDRFRDDYLSNLRRAPPAAWRTPGIFTHKIRKAGEHWCERIGDGWQDGLGPSIRARRHYQQHAATAMRADGYRQLQQNVHRRTRGKLGFQA